MEIKYTETSVKKRLFAIFLAIIFFLLMLGVRLFILQIISSKNLQYKAYTEWLRDLPMTAMRGDICDRNGTKLATSYSSFDIYARPVDIKDINQASVIISNALDKPYEEVYEKLSKKGVSEILIAKALEKDVVNKILENYVDGIFFTENTSREYLYGDLLTQILGFVSSDGNGQSGLEAYYNKYLKGVNGVSLVESDLKGHTLNSSLSYYLPAIDGMSLQLTIDIRIQKEVERILSMAQANTNAKNASAIVMDTKTGEILAVSTKPSYDLNEIPRDDVSRLMELSKAVSLTDAYEPGSTFKVITTAIALNEGLTSINDYFYCPGYRMVNGVKINCHRHSGHGSQSLPQGLSNSCNCVFMELISRIGLEKFYSYLDAFNITSGYNIDFFGEGKGVLMPKNLVTAGDLYRMGFGQSVAITQLQLVNSISACINGGNLMQPYFVKQIVNSDGNVVYNKSPTKIRSVVKPSVSSDLRLMLEKVVDGGGGKYAKIDGYKIGGKTGTAQKYENGGIAQGKYIASFMGFYPADDPRYTVLVVIDEPQGAYYGGVVAAPVAKDIFQAIFDVYETPKDLNEEQLEKMEKSSIELPNLVGLTLTEAVSKVTKLGLQYLTSGEGKFVKDQIATPGSMVSEGDIVLLIF